MQDLMDRKSIVTWKDFELTDESIRQHVIEGMKLTQLGIGFGELLSCVINEEAVFTKLDFYDGEAIDAIDNQDPLISLDGDFVLLTDTIRRLIKDLKKLLGGFAHNH
jgi:recombination associated protein RdgC